jgi:hypothetical protein
MHQPALMRLKLLATPPPDCKFTSRRVVEWFLEKLATTEERNLTGTQQSAPKVVEVSPKAEFHCLASFQRFS